jgi:hypothetical protein
MTLANRWLWLPCLAVVWLLHPTAAQAGSRGVRDGAGLFATGSVIEEVDRQIEDIHQQFGVEVLVETVAATPAERAVELKQLKADKFFPLWAEERALAARVDGVYVLVCAAPRHVEVYLSDSADKTFDKRVRAGIRKALEHALPRQGPEGLREAVAIIRERLERQERDAKSGGWAWVLWLVLAIVGAWLLVPVVRGLRGGKTVTPPSVVSSSALAGQSIYQALTRPASPVADEANHVSQPEADVQTQPYPAPAPAEPHTEGTVHG